MNLILYQSNPPLTKGRQGGVLVDAFRNLPAPLLVKEGISKSDFISGNPPLTKGRYGGVLEGILLRRGYYKSI
jgi:hypothetical protein